MEHHELSHISGTFVGTHQPRAWLHAQVQELEDANRLTPVIYDDGVSYLYVQVSAIVAHTSGIPFRLSSVPVAAAVMLSQLRVLT